MSVETFSKGLVEIIASSDDSERVENEILQVFKSLSDSSEALDVFRNFGIPVEKKIEKKVVKVAKIPVIPPKPDLVNGHSNWSTEEYLESIDPGGWVDDKRAGLLEYELADEFWRGLYEEYKKKGGTLNFKDFMEEQTKTSSKKGIKNILRI